MIKDKEDLFLFFLKQWMDKHKISILKILSKRSSTSFDLSKELNIIPPLVSYHINGNLRTPGLIKLGLVKRLLDDYDKQVGVEITPLGETILEVLE